MATNTTNTFTNHTGNGSEVNFSISFSYILTSDVDVTVAGVTKTLGTHYTISGSTVTFTVGNVPANGAAIKFQRDTSISTKAVDFQDGSVLTEQDLDNNTNQVLFAQQEITDKLSGIEEGATGDQTNAEIRTAVEAATDSNVFTDADHSKLNAIEASATADQTAAEIRTLVESASDSNVFTDADHTKLNGIEASATADQTNAEIRAAVEAATDSNVFTDADHSKLNAIEANATADQTASEIRGLVESASDSNVFTDADHTKLNGIEASATADQTNAEIKTAYEANSDTNAFTDAEKTKLSGIEASADVTDATNVNAAGAVMNSDLDTKGEILIGDGSGDPSALPVGTNNYVLVADSNEATGVKWATVPAGSGMSNLVEDTTPQLGGNLDVQASEINTSTTNGNIKLNPNGTGVVEVKGDGSSVDGTVQLNCSQNSHGVKIKSPPHSAGASYTLTLPNNDGDAGQFLKTDGSGGLSFDTVSLPDSDKIEEGNSKVEVVDTGTGYVTTEVDGTEVSRANASGSTIFTSAIFGAQTNKADGTGQGISLIYGGGTSNVGIISCTHTNGLQIKNTAGVSFGQNGSPNYTYASFFNTGGSFSTGGTARFDYDGTNINFALNVLPDTDSNYDIGTSAKRFANIYADTLYGDGSNLTGITAGAQGGGGESIFHESENTMDNDYTITANHNALVAGPLTINATLTINSPSVVTIP